MKTKSLMNLIIAAGFLVSYQTRGLTADRIYNFDEMIANANSDALPQSSTDWSYVPNTDYGRDNFDQWISAQNCVSGNCDSFVRYTNTAPGDPHMGWAWYGFLEIDDQTAISGHSLKINITGGYSSLYPTAPAGLVIDNKAEYLANATPYTNAVVGQPDLYFKSATFRPNSGTVVPPFRAAAGANRLTFYAKSSAGGRVDYGRSQPDPNWSIGPYASIDPITGATVGDSGHFYNEPLAGGRGWMKVQLDNRPDWNNGGVKPPRSLPNYISSIYGFYVTFGSMDGDAMTAWSVWIDEMQFETDSYAPQNEETINNMSVQYDRDTLTGEIGFKDKYSGRGADGRVIQSNCGNNKSSYELRYSFSPITNENWDSATPAAIQAYSRWGIEARADGRFKRVSSYAYTSVWAPFRLASAADEATFQSTRHIYFAVKDISQDPANLRQVNPNLTGTLAGQGRNYNDVCFYDYDVDVNNLPYVKRIDYVLPGAGTTPPPDTQAPSVPSGLTANALSSSQINISWDASTDNVGVTGYKVFRSGSPIGTSAVTSYNDSGLAASTTYSYTVSAYDAAGNESAQSAPASATTLAFSDTAPPTVSISGPSMVTTKNVKYVASASDNVGVTKVEFYLDDVLKTTDTSSPYIYTLNARQLSRGMHIVMAKAYDAAGNSASASMTVTKS